MKILICGSGEVGKAIAKYLSAQENDVTLIDNNKEALSIINENMDIKTIEGVPSHPDILEQANANDADMIIAVTGSDELNIMICEIASVLFKVPLKICRIKTKEYLDERIISFYKNIKAIDYVISPELEIAKAIIRNIAIPGAFEAIHVAEGKIIALGVKCVEGCPVVHTQIKQIIELFPTLNMTITGIIRNGKSIPINPEQMIMAGDNVYMVVKSDEVGRALNAFGVDVKETHKVAIFGGGKVSEILAEMIANDETINNVKLIERDKDRATDLAIAFNDKGIEVIYGDVLNPDILEEIGIKNMDMVIGTTSEDEDNILSSLLAKKVGKDQIQTISLINKQIYSSLVSNLGVDVIIDPNAITVSTILQHIRKGSISSAYSLNSEIFELLEVKVLETSKIAGQTIKELKLPKSAIIGALIRDDKIINFDNNLTIEIDDTIVIFVETKDIKALERMISVSVEYF